MKVELDLFTRSLSNLWTWSLYVPESESAVSGEIDGLRKYKSKSAARRAAKKFAEKHNFKIVEEVR